MLTEGRALRVLLADDHELVRMALRAVLEEAGVEVVGEAAGGAEALELCDALEPDVLVLDMRMPDMGGVDFSPMVIILGIYLIKRVLYQIAFSM